MLPQLRAVRFSDWEAKQWEIDKELRETTIEVTYKAHSSLMPIETEVHESQTWTRTGRGNAWSLRSRFRDLDRLAVN